MKTFYENVDFEKMSFHDASIWGFTLGGIVEKKSPFANLSFDIDYIFEWINDEGILSFKVAPCTLVFKNAWNLKMNFDTLGYALASIQIMEIKREKLKLGFFKYEFSLCSGAHKGVISFEAQEAQMTVRKLPVISKSQTLDIENRA